ncbi:universal stress protein [Streptomyces nigra]|jgi:nucleotide-binding universal stress UspA family protein|uniref:universal stress protein n=1 Tax=Streptomyces TaxID=1883 RepID=UPI000E1DEB39|nr:universal stress protein [Streptomyces sp. M7]RDS65943.1 universal stress protein [Streptomyces sp. M7]
MELPLVVGVDGSDPSLQALDWAVGEAARRGLPLRLVHGSLWERYEGGHPSVGTEPPAETLMAEHVIASAAERATLRDPEVKVSGEVMPDDAASALLREGQDATALIMGSRGRNEVAELLLGSVGLSVAARAVCPVVVVRGAEPNRHAAFGRVVVGVGDADRGANALRFALREAGSRGCALHAVRAWRSPVGEWRDRSGDSSRESRLRAEGILSGALLRAEADRHGVDVFQEVVGGPAHKVLLDAAAEADLVVVGAARRHGHFGLQLGPVAHALLHHSRSPVAVVPQWT